MEDKETFEARREFCCVVGVVGSFLKLSLTLLSIVLGTHDTPSE